MHPEARHFVDWCVAQFGPFSDGCKVLDVGSHDINGANRHYFTRCHYTGCDVTPGPNVDVVRPCHELPFAPGSFDVVISTECLEHDPHWERSLAKMHELLRHGGLVILTCASTGRPAPGGKDYYRNLTAADVAGALSAPAHFPLHRLVYNPVSKDLYFFGVKGLPAYVPATGHVPQLAARPAADAEGPNTMTTIFDRFDTDKNSRHHAYTTYYHTYLRPYTTRPGLRYLEIGVLRGESLRAFREYFPLADRVVGIDIDPRAMAVADPDRGMHVEIGDQTDAAFLRDVVSRHGPFDVILDDGSHRAADIVASFTELFPLLADGGVYVIEDTACIRHEMHFFHGLTRHLNYWRRDATGVHDDHCVDTAKFVLPVADPVHRAMGDIVFTNSAILVHKREKPHWVPRRDD